MKEDRLKWNKKFLGKEISGFKAETFVSRRLYLKKGARLLDLACGLGRNSLFFAEQGLEVFSLDISENALKAINKYQEKKGLNLKLIQYDLDDFPNGFQYGQFDGVILSFFKPSEKLWKEIHQVLKINAQVILLNFSKKQAEKHGFNEKYCLMPWEFIDLNSNLRCLHYQTYEEKAESGEIKYLDGYHFVYEMRD